MSSHSVRLSKALKDIDFILKELKSSGQLSDYDRGRFNGIQLVMSLLTGRERNFVNPYCQEAGYEKEKALIFQEHCERIR